ncbi:MAG: hypothetical protein R3C17_12075 [Planctomycetaceae bacterium]
MRPGEVSGQLRQLIGSVARHWASVAIGAQLILIAIWFSVTGLFHAVETYDTAGYLHVKWESPVDVLRDVRTPGYPLFLLIFRTISSNPDLIPLTHFVVYATSVFVFYSGLRRLSGDTTRSFVGASAVIYARVLQGYVSVISTDTLAAAVGIFVCGLIMLRLCSPGGLISAFLLLAVTAAWMIRPAYLFLVPFVPFMTWMFYPVLRPSDPARKSRNWHCMTTLLLVSMPLIFYSTLRLSVVGRFGIVSFGGFNMLGIAGQFLVDSDVPLLSEDLRDLAAAAIQRRDSGKLETREHDDLPVTNYMRMESRYDLTIWHIFSDSSQSNAERDSVKVNSQMRRLAQEIIRLHPGQYLTWLVKASRQAVRKIAWDFADNGLGCLLLMLAAVVVVLNGCRGGSWNSLEGGETSVLRILSVFSIVYCVMNLAIVIPVCPPLGRFTDSAAVLLASPLAVWILNSTWSERLTSLRVKSNSA